MSEAENTDTGGAELPRGLAGVSQLLQQKIAADGGGADKTADAGAGNDQAQQKPVAGAEDAQAAADRLLVGSPGGDAKDATTTTLHGLAETAGIDSKALYDLQVHMPDGHEPVTLGALRDKAVGAIRVDEQRQTLDDQRTAFENEQIRARQELQEVVNLLPELPPGLVQKAKEAHVAHVDADRAALLMIKPEWADPVVFRAAQDEILAAVSDYGYKRSDLDLVIDHRLTKLLHDFAGMKKRIDAANARLKQVREGGETKRPAGDPGPSKPKAREVKPAATDTAGKARAVAQLLGNLKT